MSRKAPRAVSDRHRILEYPSATQTIVYARARARALAHPLERDGEEARWNRPVLSLSAQNICSLVGITLFRDIVVGRQILLVDVRRVIILCEAIRFLHPPPVNKART